MTTGNSDAADDRAGGWSQSAMEKRFVRYGELRPCLNAFIDTRSPGSSAKENFTIIGPGVSENPEQHVHISIPHGFNIGAARQPPNCVNSQHSHSTAEVFVVHSGRWSFNFGVEGNDVRVEAGPGTVASIPTGLFRGFTNIGDEVGFLWVVLGGDDPGHVKWAPYVFEMAKDYGLVLLENGRLIDTSKGETVPPGAMAMHPTSAEEARRLRVPTLEEARGFVVSPEEFDRLPQGPLSSSAGVIEVAALGVANPREGLAPGKLGWAHGFHLRRLLFAPGGSVPMHKRQEEEVLFVHEGSLAVTWLDGEIVLNEGDTLTVPVGLERAFASAEGATMFAVRGGDSPGAPEWVGAQRLVQA